MTTKKEMKCKIDVYWTELSGFVLFFAISHYPAF